MIQTKCTPETRRRKWMIVSTVYLVPMTASRQLTSMRGSSATFRAASARSEIPCSWPLSLSGLPGVSSHQTRSSFRRLIANRLMARCAACGGLNEPPSRPMRMPLVWKGMACAADCDCISRVTACAGFCSRPRLPGAVNAIFKAGQLLGADRAAGVEFAGGNSDLRAEAELAAVGELRRCVVQHDRGIDLAEKPLGCMIVFRHDRIGMMRAVTLNVGERRIEAVDDFRRDDGVLIFGVPVLVGGGLDARIDLLHRVVAAHLAAGIDQHLDQRLQVRGSSRTIDQQRFDRTADTGTTHLGIEHDLPRHFEISRPVDVDMVD